MNNSEIKRISPFATKSTHGLWTVVDRDLVLEKANNASENDRMREIHNLHDDYDDPLQRMINAIQPGSYIRPHRHQDPPKAETFVLLNGAIGFVTFRNDGTYADEASAMLDLERGLYVIDVRAGVWHTFFALEPDTVLFETKAGPYTAVSDKDFAPWAPLDGTDETAEYLMALEDRFRAHWKLPDRLWE